MSAAKKNLSKLSREEKLKLLDVIEEKRERKKKARTAYRPHAGQLEVHTSKKYIRVCTSGNGFGKTALLCNEVVAAAFGWNPWLKEYTPVPARIMVVLDSPDKVKDQFLPELEKWVNIEEWDLRKNGKPYITEMILPNGTTIRFGFHLQEQMVFEGIEVDYIICDEPPPRHVIIGLMRGQRTKGAKPRILIAGTPIGASWMRREWYTPWSRGEREDIEFIRGKTEQNEENLAEGYLERFSRNLSEKEKRIRLEGQWAELDGLALAHLFNRDKHVMSPNLSDAVRVMFKEEKLPVVIAIDPHPSKQNHAVVLGADRHGYIFVLHEIARKLTARPFARELLELTQGYRIADTVCDSLGSQDGTGGDGFKSFIQVLNECGVRARATTYEEKKDEAFIDRILNVLELPETPGIPAKLRICVECDGLIRDIENVSWLKHRGEDIYKPKLDIGNKDYLSCLKYGLATYPMRAGNRGKIVKTKKPVSWKERHKSSNNGSKR